MRHLLRYGKWSVIGLVAGVIFLVTVVLPILWAIVAALTWWVFGLSLLVSAFIFLKPR